MTGDESPRLYDCSREGWVLHSGDGRFVYIGDSGDVVDTTTRKSIINLNTLYNTRKVLEIDWANGVPVFTTSRYGLGYVTGGGPTPTPSPSPSPGLALAQDTFQRANQPHWGTASDGNIWGGNANKLSVFSILNDTGKVSNGSGNYSALLGPVATDAEVLFTGSMSAFNSTNLGAVLRYTDSNNWYRAYINGSKLVLQKRVNGTTTTIGSTPFTAVGGTSYSLRFRVVGTTLYARVWQTGTTEPVSWTVTVTDTSLSSGYCGLRMLVQNGVTATYTFFLATSA
jgi:hypothetical protein